MGDGTVYKIVVSGQDEAKFWDVFIAGAQLRAGRGHDDEHPVYIFEARTKYFHREQDASITFFCAKPRVERGKPIVATVSGVPDGLFYRDVKWHGYIPVAGFEKLKIRVEIVGGGLEHPNTNYPWSYRVIVENGKRISKEFAEDLSLLEQHAPEAVELLPPPYEPTEDDLATDREEEEEEERNLAEVVRLWPLMKPGDVFEVLAEGELPLYCAVVEKAGETWAVVRQHADVVDGTLVFSGWEKKIWKKNTLRLLPREASCSHGHDIRSSTPCGDCQMAVRLMIGGLHGRTVL